MLCTSFLGLQEVDLSQPSDDDTQEEKPQPFAAGWGFRTTPDATEQ